MSTHLNQTIATVRRPDASENAQDSSCRQLIISTHHHGSDSIWRSVRASKSESQTWVRRPARPQSYPHSNIIQSLLLCDIEPNHCLTGKTCPSLIWELPPGLESALSQAWVWLGEGPSFIHWFYSSPLNIAHCLYPSSPIFHSQIHFQWHQERELLLDSLIY